MRDDQPDVGMFLSLPPQAPSPTGGVRQGGAVATATLEAVAILDRFLQTAEIVEITGKSYRLYDRASKTAN